MSLKRMAMNMAIAFAAAKGYQSFRNRGGMAGVKQMMARAGTGQGGGGTGGGIMGLLGGARGGGGGGLGSLLGGLTGGGGSGGGGLGAALGGGGGAAGGLLGGLAAMAGGTTGAGGDYEAQAEAGPQDEETAAAMIRAIGQAVRADGVIDAEERDALQEMLGEADTPEERDAINAALSEPVDPEGLASDVPRGHEAEVYAAALTAIDPDHPAERDFLTRFSTALRMDPQEVAQLHQMAGKPAP